MLINKIYVANLIKKRKLLIPAFLGLVLLVGLPGFSAAAEQITPAEQENSLISAGSIYREYVDTNTVNHPLFVDPLANGNYLVSRVGFKEPSVQEIDPSDRVVWSLDGVQPVSAKRLPDGNTLVADSGAPGPPYMPRVLEVSPAGQVVWEHRFNSLAEAPRYAEKLANGNVLVTLPFMIVEVDRQNRVVWSYGSSRPLSPGSAGYLEQPVLATGLTNGNILVVDRGLAGGIILEINSGKQVVWQFGRRWAGAESETEPDFLAAPSGACRLENGNTIVADPGTRRLLVIDAGGNITGKLNWTAVLQDYPVMNIWQAVPAEEKLLLVLTLANSHSRILEVETAAY